MAPKIEELENGRQTKVTKNPFEPRKTTTVQRSRDEVYPERKGLHKPQYLGDSELDLLFQKLEKILEPKLEDISIEQLGESMFGKRDVPDIRKAVVGQLLDYLIEAKEFSLKVNEKSNDKNLLSISLHDIKTFAKLVNVIIILGIYPCIMPLRIGIPLEKEDSRTLARQSTSLSKLTIYLLPWAPSHMLRDIESMKACLLLCTRSLHKYSSSPRMFNNF